MDYLLFFSSIIFFTVSMCFTPGPNNAMVMAIGLEKGFKAALPFCAGANAGATATLLLLGLGLGELFTRFPVAYDVLRYVGSAYMLWLAWRISGLRPPFSLSGSPGEEAALKTGTDAAPAPGAAESAATAESAAGTAGEADKTGEPDKAGEAGKTGKAGKTGSSIKPFTFFQAFFFQLLNVKVWLANVIIVSNYVGTGSGMWARLAFCALLFTVTGAAAMCTWAAGGMFMRRFLTSGGMRRANYVFGAFLALSVILLFV